MTKTTRADNGIPWWDSWIPIAYLVWAIISALLWYTLFAPNSYEWLWPVAAVMGGYAATGIMIHAVRSKND